MYCQELESSARHSEICTLLQSFLEIHFFDGFVMFLRLFPSTLRTSLNPPLALMAKSGGVLN